MPEGMKHYIGTAVVAHNVFILIVIVTYNLDFYCCVRILAVTPT